MASAPDSALDRERRRHLERQTAVLFAVTTLSMAIICGSLIVSGWFAGVIQDQYERFFWLGAVLAGVMVVVFTAAVVPGGTNDRGTIRRITWLVRIGLLLFVLAPALCLGALIADFFF